jgi:hypothetical protein
MTQVTDPPSGGWDGIRLRYEAGEEKVEAIAASVGMHRLTLSLKAKALGWKLRTQTSAPRAAAAASASRTETTQETLRRLKELLQVRIGKLEQELADIGEELDQLGRERQMRSVSTIVRTLDKVLDLERKDINQRKRARKNFQHFDEAQRVALAEKIERLEAEGPGQNHGAGAGPDGSAGTELPVAVLGAADTATATNGTE